MMGEGDGESTHVRTTAHGALLRHPKNWKSNCCRKPLNMHTNGPNCSKWQQAREQSATFWSSRSACKEVTVPKQVGTLSSAHRS